MSIESEVRNLIEICNTEKPTLDFLLCDVCLKQNSWKRANYFDNRNNKHIPLCRHHYIRRFERLRRKHGDSND